MPDASPAAQHYKIEMVSLFKMKKPQVKSKSHLRLFD